MTDTEDIRLSRLAVRRRLISQEGIDKAFTVFRQTLEDGSRLSFGEFLVKEAHITRGQLEDLLEQQGKQQTREFVPGYEFIKKLGEGAMGEVYLARQKSLDRLVAVKTLPRHLAKDQEFLARFQREARLAAKIDHVNAVRALDVGEHSGHHYFVMEYVEGNSLSAVLDAEGVLTEEFALHVTMQIARVLDYAHERGILHRDVKPGNILVTKAGIAKLCDLGLAKQLDMESQMTLTGMTLGTPHYTSPEQARGDKDVDTRSDIYSLGATLYHLMTGGTPFSGTSAATVLTKHLTEEVPWPADINPKVSESCCLLIEKMMAKDRADRYASAKELIADMELVIDGKELPPKVRPAGRSSVRPAVTATQYRRERRKVPPALIWGSVAGLVLLAIVAGYVLSRRETDETGDARPVSEYAPSPPAAPSPSIAGEGAILYMSFDSATVSRSADGRWMVRDLSGRDNHGVWHGGEPTPGPGVRGECLTFDGTDDCVIIPDSPSLNPASITICAWVHRIRDSKADNVASFTIVGKHNDSGNQRGYFLSLAGRLLVLGASDNGKTHMNTGTAGAGMRTTSWQHVAGMYHAGKASLYINGKSQDTQSKGNRKGELFDNDTPLQIGATESIVGGMRRGGMRRWFKGMIDEVRIYDRPLTAEEIARLAADRPEE